ncbi:NAD(P)/FAD-dependent oxidoreductase [Novosphingobium sp. M1R2S20]|uniref:NAD(P)/FAD-dependent oxidoreductase n=1 Tax=Novosphingobium rhizovicinum TaxID=3228928 RepID=A0ABV3R957_9SPHN
MKPIIVLGGGLAGASVAARLARAGHAVTVLERETGPHEKVCGEFLSVEACSDLETMGLDAHRLGGVPIDRVRVHHRARSIEAKLPFLARGLSRAVLDEALLQLASRSGADVQRGVRVSGVDGRKVLTSEGAYEAEHIMLATGKHDLRGHARSTPATKDGYIGLKMHWRLSRSALEALGPAIELILFDHGYAGLQRVGARDANLCLVIRRDRFANIEGGWDGLVASLMGEPGLRQRLNDAEPLFAKPLAIANLPYGYIHQPQSDEPAHLWRLGDQAAMTASLTGDGMAVALRSARLAADCFQRGASSAAFQALLARHAGTQVRRAMRLQRLSERPLALRLGLLAAELCPWLLAKSAGFTRLPSYPHVV